jgi:hypothetical protein
MANGDTHNLGIGYLLWIFGVLYDYWTLNAQIAETNTTRN